jgi:hypothetical protein
MPTGIYKRTDEYRKKLSIATKKIWTPEYKKLINIKRTGVKRGIYKNGIYKKTKPKYKPKLSREDIKLKLSMIAKRDGRGKWMKGRKGSLSPNWRGGKTKDAMLIRSSIEYDLWRNSVFARDNWTCQKTGEKGCKLVAHHINNFADFPELRTSIENGITLSEKSHREFHKKYGNKNTNENQLYDFIKANND